MKRLLSRVLWVCLMATIPARGASPDSLRSETVAPGIIHHHDYRASGPWQIHVLEINCTHRWVSFESVASGDLFRGLERTSSMAARNSYDGHKVAGAINADFYMVDGRSVGAQVIAGELVKGPHSRRSVFAISDDGSPMMNVVALTCQLMANDGTAFPVSDINTARLTDHLVLYNRYMGTTTGTNHWGTEVSLHYLEQGPVVNDTVWAVVMAKDSIVEGGHGNSVIPGNGLVLSGHGRSAIYLNRHVFVGDTVAYLLRLPPMTRPIITLVGGTPRLIRDGVATVEWKQEAVGERFTTDRHPRTAIGFNRDSTKVYFFSVDGRQENYSHGMSLNELADYMLSWDVYQGLNLDGGGSTTLVVADKLINRPSDPDGERHVANSLLVITTAPADSLLKQ